MQITWRVIPALLWPLAAFGQTSPPRLEFEVASARPSPPLVPGQVNVGVHVDGAQVRCTSLALKAYIAMAHRVKEYQVSGPDWLVSERFDIAAKLPAGATREQIPEMVQTLLADRFQLKLHRDKKEFAVYGLLVAKGGSKMKESPLGSGEGARSAVNVTANGGPGGTTVNLGNGAAFSVGNNRFEATKLTMPALADSLARFVDRPIVDMTGLKGAYDFTLEFSPEDFRAMMIRAAISAGVALPPEAHQLLETASGDSLFSAVQTLGLRLEPRKAPLDVLVIDHVQKTPAEN